MSNDQKSNRSFGGLFLFLFSLVLLVWGLCLLISTGMIPEINKIIPVIPIKDYSELGSAMGIANGLFSALAIIMALYAIILQGRSLAAQEKANSIQMEQIILEQKYKRVAWLEFMRDKTIKNLEIDIIDFILKNSKEGTEKDNINKFYSKLDINHIVDREYDIDGKLKRRSLCSKRGFAKAIGDLVTCLEKTNFFVLTKINEDELNYFKKNIDKKISIYLRYHYEYYKLNEYLKNLNRESSQVLNKQ